MSQKLNELNLKTPVPKQVTTNDVSAMNKRLDEINAKLKKLINHTDENK